MHHYFIYCRKSTEDDDHQVLSLESQRLELSRFAVQHELLVVGTFSESKSARAPGNRPIFTEMLKSIVRGEATSMPCTMETQ